MARIIEPYVKVTERVRETPTLLNIDGSTNMGGVVVSPKGRSYQYISGPKDFLEKLVGADELPRDSHISLVNAYYCSYFSGLVIARSLNTTAVQAIKLVPGTDGATATKVTYLNDTELNSSVNITLSSSVSTSDFNSDFNNDFGSNDDSGAGLPGKAKNGYYISDWYFTLNDVVFYGVKVDTENGETEDEARDRYLNKIYLEVDNYNKYQFIYCDQGITSVLANINSWNGYIASAESKSLIKIKYNTPAGLKPSNIVKVNEDYHDVVTITATYESDDVIEEPEKCILFRLTDPSDGDNMSIALTRQGTTDVYLLEVYDGTSIKGRYYISALHDGKDASGNNCFIENYNPQLNYIQFDVHGEFTDSDVLTLAKTQFNESLVDINACKKSAALSSAIYKLGDQKEFRIEYLSDFGITDSTFIKDYVKVGEDNFWFTPVDIPYTYSNAESMNMFGSGVKNSNNVIICGPFDKNSTFTGWLTYIAWSSLYYERIYTNRAAKSEYAPVFEQTNGILSYRNPLVTLGEFDRTKLLNGSAGPIDYVVYNQAENIYYANDNRCHTTTNNVMSEEMNRRLVNRIKKDAIEVVNRFKGQTNTESTRNNVESLLKIYMDQNIMTQNYKPVEYEIQCNTDNNTTEIITSNKLAVALRIRLLGSIKFVDVLVDVFPLGVEFTA